jgi:hypothetical protein
MGDISARSIEIKKNCFVKFEVFTAVTMKNVVFWDVALCSSCVNRRFGATYRLHRQIRKIPERGTNVNRCSGSHKITRRHIPEDGILQIIVLFAI